MSRKRRPLRASFIVITASAGAAAIAAVGASACSSSSTTSNSASPDASGGSPKDAAGASTSCPATAPNNGDPCSGTFMCTYDAGMYCSTYLTTNATCTTGAWSVSSEGVSCNPGIPTADASDDADAGPTSNGDPDGGDAGD